MGKDKLEIGLNKLEGIFARYDDVCDSQAKNIVSQDGFYSEQQVASHISELRDENRVLKIGIIGRVKAGKSSLINSLLFNGKEVLPKAATPMTAALTSIGYADRFSAKVRFFSKDDIKQIRINADQYNADLEAWIANQKKEMSERLAKQPERPVKEMSDEKLRAMAARKINDGGGVLSAAADLWVRIQQADVDVSSLPAEQELEAVSEDDLNKQLLEYVGSSGKFMPFTQELQLGMPVESLKGIEVLDTPGLNDPVKSREQRTYERLKECSAAFIVSPAGQFLSAQDFELADRISAREGTQEIFVVASQADTQLHGSERTNHKGQLPLVVAGIKSIMEQQAKKSLGTSDNEVLKAITNDLNKRLILTSGICQSLLLGGNAASDPTAAHVMELFKKNYSDYFASEDDQRSNLAMLSGQKPLLEAVQSVQAEKNRILQVQESHFVNAQWQTFKKVRDELVRHFERTKSKIENADKQSVEARLAKLEAASNKGGLAADNVFQDLIEELELALSSQLGGVFEEAINRVDEQMEMAEGTETSEYQVKSDYLGSSIARFLRVGGYETRSRTEDTLKPRKVKRALEGIAQLVHKGLEECAAAKMHSWQNELIANLSRKLRAVIGSDLVDADDLESVCRATVRKIKDLPKPEVPSLPKNLTVSKILRGSEVSEYVDNAESYMSVLKSCANHFSDDVSSSLKSTASKGIGIDLMRNMVEEITLHRDMLEHKTLTIEKMNRLIGELKEL